MLPVRAEQLTTVKTNSSYKNVKNQEAVKSQYCLSVLKLLKATNNLTVKSEIMTLITDKNRLTDQVVFMLNSTQK